MILKNDSKRFRLVKDRLTNKYMMTSDVRNPGEDDEMVYCRYWNNAQNEFNFMWVYTKELIFTHKVKKNQIGFL